MLKNIGKNDRIIRVAAGLILTPMAFVGPESSWFLLGLVPLVTGLVGSCPAYSIFGINTNAWASDACCGGSAKSPQH